MSKLIALGINLSKIDKKHLNVAKNGDTYLNASFFLKEEADQYGNHGMITQNVSKEAREQGVRGEILGNAKVMGEYGDRQPNRAPNRVPSKPAQMVLNDDIDDELPF